MAAIALVVVACGSPSPPASNTAEISGTFCPDVQEDANPQAVAIGVIDRTASGASPELRSERMADIARLVRWAIDHQASLTIAYFDGSTASIDVDPCVAGLVMAPAGSNSRTREANAKRLQTDIENLIARRLNGAARATGSDPLGAIRFAVDTAQMLSDGENARPIMVMIASDFVGTSGCLDLRGLAVGDDAVAAEALQYCVDASLVPDASGINLVLVGVGRVTRPELIPSESQTWLTRLYSDVCDSTGADSCQVTPRILGDL